MKDGRTTEFQDMLTALRVLGVDPEHNAAGTEGNRGVGSAKHPSWAALNRLERENALLIDHAEMLACALGACPNCWGTIEDCEDCDGIGHPGAFNPDPACFDHFVLPVITRVMSRSEAEPTGATLRRDRYSQV